MLNYSCRKVRFDSDSIATHDKQTLTAVSTTNLFNLAKNIKGADYDVIGIDEGDIFPDIVGFIKNVSFLTVKTFHSYT
jgi:hypothetical protein